MDDFNAKVDKLGSQKVEPLCYIRHSFSMDDKIDVEFLMPLKEAVIPCDALDTTKRQIAHLPFEEL